jgi:molybdenum cofactor cytidylyltransferase
VTLFGDVVAVLLCAGLSQRYGPADKLLAPLDGRPLVAHAAGTIGALPFARRLAVVQAGPVGAIVAAAGFDLVVNDRPADGQDRSVRLGIEAALAVDPRAILVCLGDMPFVTAAHLAALAQGEGAAMSVADGAPSPPTLIPIDLARAILADDRPVRALMRAARPALVAAPAEVLRDFDLPTDFPAQ